MNFLWPILILLTLLRFFVAAAGHLGESESYLLLCSGHLDWGFVEGPSGVAALLAASKYFFGTAPWSLRLLSPLMAFCASWLLARLARLLRGEKVAWWSVIIWNLLPLTNAASFVIEGTMVIALAWIALLHVGWLLLSLEKEDKKIPHKELFLWVLFGGVLALGTECTYAVGWLLPVVMGLYFFNKKRHGNILGPGIATCLLGLPWVGVLFWNARHDWVQWSHQTWSSFWLWSFPSFYQLSSSPLFWSIFLLIPFYILGIVDFIPWRRSDAKAQKKSTSFLCLVFVPFFCWLNAFGHQQPAFGLLLALTGVLLPGAIHYCLKYVPLRKMGIGCAGLLASYSLLVALGVSFSNSVISVWNFPSAQGVVGVKAVAVELLRLRAVQADQAGHSPFIIAQTPGLAALVGSRLPISYPEMKTAPAVFIPESPAFMSQFYLWPHYADAIAMAPVDPLYTEEKVVSPFLGRSALYLTTESPEELPQIIQGAFAKVTPLSEVTLEKEKVPQHLLIYLCEGYRMLAL